MKLNTDKTYSDGEKVKASNVAQSYRWFRSQDNSYKDLLTRISSVKVTDDETLVFTFNTVDSRILQYLIFLLFISHIRKTIIR